MTATLAIFSGLPGTGKSTLADQVAMQLKWPILRIDDIVGFIPEHMRKHAHPFWEDMIGIMLNLAGAQLEIGVSLVIDSVFMGADRAQAFDLAAQYKAKFRAIYTFVSDERVWHERVDRRHADLPPDWGVATWERIQRQRLDFWPWSAESALFVDAVEPTESNFAKVMDFIAAPNIKLKRP